MGLIDIEHLLTLNKFRDTFYEGHYKTRTIEIQVNRNIVEGIDNPKYKNLKVKDGLHKHDGIIDTMIRMCFEERKVLYKQSKKECKEQLLPYTSEEEFTEGIYDPLSITSKTLLGCYINHKEVGKKDSPWDTYFKTAMKIYNKEHNYSVSKYDKENNFAEGIYLAFKALVEYTEGNYNYKIKYPINCVQDFKDILIDSDKSKGVVNYLLGIIAYDSKKDAVLGKHQDKLIKQCKNKETGKRENYSCFFGFDYLDEEINTGNSNYSNKYDMLEIPEYVESNYSEPLVKDILKIRNKIFTTRQNKYIDLMLNMDNKRIDISRGLKKADLKKIENKLRYICEKEFNTNRNIVNVNGRYINKADILSILEDILTKDTLKESFIELIEILDIMIDDKLTDDIVDRIYSLDHKYYKPIVKAINTREFDDNYINGDFRIVIQELEDLYNYHIKENKQIYNYNRSKIEKNLNIFTQWLDENIFKYTSTGEVISKEIEDIDLVTTKNLLEKYNSLFNENITVKGITHFLLKLDVKMIAGEGGRSGDTTYHKHKLIKLNKYFPNNYNINKFSYLEENFISDEEKKQIKLNNLNEFLNDNLVDGILLASNIKSKYLTSNKLKQFIRDTFNINVSSMEVMFDEFIRKTYDVSKLKYIRIDGKQYRMYKLTKIQG